MDSSRGIHPALWCKSVSDLHYFGNRRRQNTHRCFRMAKAFSRAVWPFQHLPVDLSPVRVSGIIASVVLYK